MAKEVLCPTCGAKYNLAEEQPGKKVRCTRCEHAFAAGGEERRRDDDRPKQARPRAPKGPGVPVVPIVLACVAVGVLVLCGGAGLWYFWPFAGPPPNPPVVQRPRPALAEVNPPAPAVPPGPFARPGFPGAAVGPAVGNVKEALDAVRDNNPERRRAGADWLSRAPRDEDRAVEVSRALDPLVRNAQPDFTGSDPPREAALSALKVWGTKENVPTLVRFLQVEKGNMGAQVHMQNQLKDAMAALARIGDERGVEAILPWVGNIFLGGAGEVALRQMGPGAEKALVKSYDDPSDRRRKVVRGLLQEIGTKPEVFLDQVVADLKTGNAGHRAIPADFPGIPDDLLPVSDDLPRARSRPGAAGYREIAAESLEKLPVVEARRAEVSRALNSALEDPDADVALTGLKAARTWGTKENVDALVRHVGEGGPFSTPQRVAAMEALANIQDERGVWPVARWLGDFFNGKAAEPAIQKFGPVAQKVGLDHLKDADAPSRLQAWRTLALVGTKANVATMNAAAAKERDAKNRDAAAVAIRSAQLRP